MQCEECRGLLEEYLDDALSPAVRREMATHMATCAECRVLYEELVRVRELYRQYIIAAIPDIDIAALVLPRLTAPAAGGAGRPLLAAALALLALALTAAWLTAAVWAPFVLVGYELAGQLLPVPAIILAAFPLVKIGTAVVLIVTLAAAAVGMRRVILP